LETQSAILSRNVTWVDKVYGEYRNKTEEEVSGDLIIPELEYDETLDENEENPIDDNPIEEMDDDVEVPPKTRISGVNRELRNLDTFFNPTMENVNISTIYF
jgi:hypothetical protein